MTTDPKTTATAAAKQNTLAHRPAAQGILNQQPTIRPGPSSSTARFAASSSAQAGQGTKFAPVQPVKANSVNTKNKTVVPAKTVAPPPTFPNRMPEGFKLWKAVKSLNTTPAADKPRKEFRRIGVFSVWRVLVSLDVPGN